MAQFKMWTWETDLSTTVMAVNDLFNSAGNPSYTNCSVQQYFPKKVSHTLLNGNFATFTPNVRHRITVDFAFITADQYQVLLSNFNKLVLIQPELGTDTSFIPSDLKQNSGSASTGCFKVMWADNGVEFTYSDTYKGAGYSGSVNFFDLKI